MASGAIVDEVRPRRIAIVEGIPGLLTPAGEPGLEPTAALSDAGRGEAMLLRIAESRGQRGHDGLGAADGGLGGSFRCGRAACKAEQQAAHRYSDACCH
mgnify:CR=1 FL=1